MTPLQRSQRLADALKDVGIEVDEITLVPNNFGSHRDVLLIDDLMVLMDAWFKLGGELNKTTDRGLSTVEVWCDESDIYSMRHFTEIDVSDWQSALCAALVEAIEKKLGVSDGYT